MVMAPIKFEEHIKESLGNRKLEPSKDSWSKLNNRLENDAQKKKPIWLWMAVAATVAGFIFLATTVFNTEATTQPESNMVNVDDVTPTKNVIKDAIVQQKDDKLAEVNETIENTSETKEENALKTESNRRVAQTSNTTETVKNVKKQTEERFIDPTPNRKTTIVEQTPIPSEKIEITPKVETKTNLPQEDINQKIKEAIAIVEQKNNNKEEITDAYIDSLLQSAYASVTSKKESLIDANGSVDASSLLAEVEQDLEKSFRNKVFEALKTGFEEVRTAVVNRNQ